MVCVSVTECDFIIILCEYVIKRHGVNCYWSQTIHTLYKWESDSIIRMSPAHLLHV